jgi:hypothetical protein
MKFTRIDRDPIMQSEDLLIRTLLRLKKMVFDWIDDYNLARPLGSRAARLYGLPKLHKSSVSLRPVMSATKTVGYGLGKMWMRRLSGFRHSPYDIENSWLGQCRQDNDLVRCYKSVHQCSTHIHYRLLTSVVLNWFFHWQIWFKWSMKHRQWNQRMKYFVQRNT